MDKKFELELTKAALRARGIKPVTKNPDEVADMMLLWAMALMINDFETEEGKRVSTVFATWLAMWQDEEMRNLFLEQAKEAREFAQSLVKL